MEQSVKILLIEDLQDADGLFKEVLSDSAILYSLDIHFTSGHSYPVFKNECTLIETANPDLIFLDINLAKDYAVHLLSLIKNDVRFKFIPVIIFTSSVSQARINELYKLRANCVVIRPQDKEDIKLKMKPLLHYWLNIVKLPVLYA